MEGVLIPFCKDHFNLDHSVTIIGAGMYVDNEVGGACATGVGELVMKTLGSFLIVELMRQGMNPQEACEEAVMRIVAKEEYKDMIQCCRLFSY